jgi:hypothetical protein
MAATIVNKSREGALTPQSAASFNNRYGFCPRARRRLSK